MSGQSHRRRRVCGFEADAVGGEAIQRRRQTRSISIRAEAIGAEGVDCDEQDVAASSRSRRSLWSNAYEEPQTGRDERQQSRDERKGDAPGPMRARVFLWLLLRATRQGYGDLGSAAGSGLGGLGRSRLIAAPPKKEVPFRSTTWFPSSRYCRIALSHCRPMVAVSFIQSP